jgi:hypothetical protein
MGFVQRPPHSLAGQDTSRQALTDNRASYLIEAYSNIALDA